MDYMFQDGFLGTRAPFFMDFVMIIVVLLPLLTLIAISMAKVKSYKLHSLTQTTIFIIYTIVIGYFEYGVRAGGGFETFMEGSNISYSYSFWVLLLHITIATISLIIWIKTLWLAKKEKKNHTLSGSYSKIHKKDGQLTFIGIFMTAFTGIWVYFLLFVY